MISFQQLSDNNARPYVKVTTDGSDINLGCGKYDIQRIPATSGEAVFTVFHKDLHRELRFTRADVSAPAAATDEDLHFALVDIFDCCPCAGADCEDCCIAPPGYSILVFSLLPGNQLDTISQTLFNVRAGIGPCDDPCFELFSGLDMLPVTDRGDFANQVVNYITSNPPPGFVSSFPTITNDGVIKIVIFMSAQNCCDQPLYMLSDDFGCGEGPFDPEFFSVSSPEQNCCSEPAPCELGIDPDNSIFTFTFNILTLPYTPTGLTLTTNEGDCFSMIFGSEPTTAIYSSSDMATLYYNFAVAQVGTGGIVAVTQPDAQSVSIEISGRDCCGMTFSMNSTNPAWNLILADPLQVIKSSIQCCP